MSKKHYSNHAKRNQATLAFYTPVESTQTLEQLERCLYVEPMAHDVAQLVEALKEANTLFYKLPSSQRGKAHKQMLVLLNRSETLPVRSETQRTERALLKQLFAFRTATQPWLKTRINRVNRTPLDEMREIYHRLSKGLNDAVKHGNMYKNVLEGLVNDYATNTLATICLAPRDEAGRMVEEWVQGYEYTRSLLARTATDSPFHSAFLTIVGIHLALLKANLRNGVPLTTGIMIRG